jgi:hypothetical protein
MAVTFISIDSFPTYLALSSDIAAGKIAEATLIGKTVYLTDTGAWKIVTAGDGTVVDYKSPAFPA